MFFVGGILCNIEASVNAGARGVDGGVTQMS